MISRKAVIKTFFLAVMVIMVCGPAANGLGASNVGGTHEGAEAQPKLDILFVIDNSGSMRKNDPHFITREVVTEFSNGLANQSRLGMVIFDHDARLVEPLTEKTGPEAQASFIRNLNEVNYRGQFTNSPAGIERAIYELKMNGRDDAEKVIIFLTDGIVDTGDKARDIEKEKWLRLDLATESKKEGIRIIGIAFTEKADVHLIQTLAIKTDGEYFRAYRAGDIPGIFSRINDLINKQPTQTIASEVSSPHTDVPTPAGTSQESPPSGGLGASAEHPSARWRDVLPLVLAVVAIVLLGTMFFIRFYRGRAEVRTAPSPTPPVQDGPLPQGRSMPEARLIDLKNVTSNGVFPFALDKRRITVGRDANNDIVIPEETVSGFHATIEYNDGYFYLEDHRSTNGTFLNKKELKHSKPVKLKSGEKMRFADHEFQFLVLDQVPVGETVMLQSSSLPMEVKHLRTQASKETVDDHALFKDCLNKHLLSISDLGSTYESFVHKFMNDNVVDTLAVKAEEIMGLTQKDLDEHRAVLETPPVLFQLCSLPVEIEHAQAWFAKKHGGFVKVLAQCFDSDQFATQECTTLCFVTYGRTEQAWISMTIVSADRGSDQVEIMSVEFLSEEEKDSLSLDFGKLGSIM